MNQKGHYIFIEQQPDSKALIDYATDVFGRDVTIKIERRGEHINIRVECGEPESSEFRFEDMSVHLKELS